MRIQYLSKEHLDQHWDSISNFLEKGLFYSEGEMDVAQLRMLIVQGSAHVILIIDDEDNTRGALAFQLVAYPNIRTAQIISYGGYNLFADKDLLESLLVGIRKTGATRLDGLCKPAQTRLFRMKYGFETPYQVITLKV